MKKANKKIIILVIVFVVAIGIFIINQDTTTIIASSSDENSIDYVKFNNFETDIDQIYDLDYQNKIAKQIDKLIDKNDYSFDQPLLIANPFGTNTTSIYMYFKTETNCKASYTIKCAGYEDLSRNLNNSNGTYANEHEYLLVGCIPEKTNTITVTLTDQQNQTVASLSWNYDAPALIGSSDNATLDVTKGESSQTLSEGFYTMLGNRSEENNEQTDFILIYDNSGTIRSEIPIISYRSCRLLFNGDTMSYSISSSKIATMKQTGQIIAIYDSDQYRLHHDYINGSHNDLLVLASKANSETEEDLIISIDRDNGEIDELIDLKDLFSNYYKLLSNDEDEPLDWIHVNSIELIDDNTIIISSRETSSIIKISNIYDNPKIDYIIGSKQFWQESGYDDLVLDKSGDFSINAGQHCVVYQEDDSLNSNQYYLYFYNNNNTICSTRDYNYESDDNYYDTGIATKGDYSYYDKYLVDETNQTFTLVKRIPVNYSGYVSSVQELDNGNILIDSGSVFEAYEYDSNNQLIQKVTGTGATWWYRVFKYDYQNFWFTG